MDHSMPECPRLYTETKIWIPSSSAWTTNTERRLEETLGVSRPRIPLSAPSKSVLAFAVWMAVIWRDARITPPAKASIAQYLWAGDYCGTGCTCTGAPIALSHGMPDCTCIFGCWVARMQLPARLTWPRRLHGEPFVTPQGGCTRLGVSGRVRFYSCSVNRGIVKTAALAR